jgi:hypothetical protein
LSLLPPQRRSLPTGTSFMISILLPKNIHSA